jgi:hypothetical protein
MREAHHSGYVLAAAKKKGATNGAKRESLG